MSRQLSNAKVESTQQSTLVSTKSTQKPIVGSFLQSSQQKPGYKLDYNFSSKRTSFFDNESKNGYCKKTRERPSQDVVETVRVISDEEDKEITHHLETSTYLNINEDLVNGLNKSKHQMSKNLKNPMSVGEQACRKQLMQHHLSVIETMGLLDLSAAREIAKQATDQLFQQNIVCPPSEIEVWRVRSADFLLLGSVMMLIFKDAFTGDELSSDSFPLKLVDGLVYEFKGKHVVRKEGEVVLAGSNPSAEAEDGDEYGNEENVERGIDFVLNHKLIEMNCYESLDIFKSYIKGFMKKVIEHMEKNGKSAEQVVEFKKKIQGWVVSLMSKDRFKNLQFFIGENMAEGRGEGQICIVEYRNEADGEHPYLLLVKEALVEEKC